MQFSLPRPQKNPHPITHPTMMTLVHNKQANAIHIDKALEKRIAKALPRSHNQLIRVEQQRPIARHPTTAVRGGATIRIRPSGTAHATDSQVNVLVEKLRLLLDKRHGGNEKEASLRRWRRVRRLVVVEIGAAAEMCKLLDEHARNVGLARARSETDDGVAASRSIEHFILLLLDDMKCFFLQNLKMRRKIEWKIDDNLIVARRKLVGWQCVGLISLSIVMMAR